MKWLFRILGGMVILFGVLFILAGVEMISGGIHSLDPLSILAFLEDPLIGTGICYGGYKITKFRLREDGEQQAKE